MKLEQEIILEGHIIDSLFLTRILDKIIERGADYNLISCTVGKTSSDTSEARLVIKAPTREKLDSIVAEIKKEGCVLPEMADVHLEMTDKDGVFPEGFYSTSNHKTFIKHEGRMIEAGGTKMDGAIVVDPKTGTATTKKFSQVNAGDLVVTGDAGVLVQPPARKKEKSGGFTFMSADVSTERPSELIIERVAQEMARIKTSGGKIGFVTGPAVVHAGGSRGFISILEKGYVSFLLTGNALAVHDIEHALLGTSLGINVKTGESTEGGHRNHLKAINAIKRAGSIASAVKDGTLNSGIMHACITRNVPFFLAGSIRDDGPLPEVETDIVKAQLEMMEALQAADMVVIIATMLHAIAVGNLLPSHVKTICVDVNPAMVTKLVDRGSQQAMGIIADAGLFLKILDEKLP